MSFLKTTLPLLLLIFGISVLLRLPQLGRPLSKHHEFCTAVSLRVLDIWWEEGVGTHHFSPVMNYPGEANKFINNHAQTSGQMIDHRGNAYYVSHPPFAYLLPYSIFKITGVPPSVLGLQIIHLFIHFLSALFVYFTVCLLSFNRARNLPYLPAVVAFVVYVFNPAALWFQSNVYMADMLVQLPFVLGTYTALKLIIRQRFYSFKYLFFYCLLLFLMMYSSWLGYFFAAGMIIYALLHLHKHQGFKWLIFLSLLCTFLALRFTLVQYASVNGLNAIVNEAVSRYLVRGSLGDLQNGYFAFVKFYAYYLIKIMLNYISSYLPIYIAILWFALTASRQKKMKILFSENGYRFIWLSVLPVLLLHFVFLEYSGQDFTTLYAALFFSVLMGILYDKLRRSGITNQKKLNLIVIAGTFLMILQFTLINLPGNNSVKGFRYDTYREAGQRIAKISRADEVIFLLKGVAEPQLIYYAKRNIKEVESEEDARRFLEVRGIKRGVIFGAENPAGQSYPLIKHIYINSI